MTYLFLNQHRIVHYTLPSLRLSTSQDISDKGCVTRKEKNKMVLFPHRYRRWQWTDRSRAIERKEIWVTPMKDNGTQKGFLVLLLGQVLDFWCYGWTSNNSVVQASSGRIEGWGLPFRTRHPWPWLHSVMPMVSTCHWKHISPYRLFSPLRLTREIISKLLFTGHFLFPDFCWPRLPTILADGLHVPYTLGSRSSQSVCCFSDSQSQELPIIKRPIQLLQNQLCRESQLLACQIGCTNGSRDPFINIH